MLALVVNHERSISPHRVRSLYSSALGQYLIRHEHTDMKCSNALRAVCVRHCVCASVRMLGALEVSKPAHKDF